MVVKILKPVKGFPGVRYNTDKVDRNKGELMRVANFGPLQYLGILRPEDYVNYLKMISALNRRVEKPQFHAVISGKGKTYNKEELTAIGEAWMKEMGYGHQPYLVIYHKDTDNNHVHLVSTRVSRSGVKIDSAYEKIRSQKAMSSVLGFDQALVYRFSTVAQFYSILESLGYPGRNFDEKKLIRHIESNPVSKHRAVELNALLKEWVLGGRDYDALLQRGVHLIFHAAEGKRHYGYTIVDHNTKQVFKGSEVLPLKELLGKELVVEFSNPGSAEKTPFEPVHHIPPIWIANDVDDQQVLGMKRRRQKKSRTNTR